MQAAALMFEITRPATFMEGQKTVLGKISGVED